MIEDVFCAKFDRRRKGVIMGIRDKNNRKCLIEVEPGLKEYLEISSAQNGNLYEFLDAVVDVAVWKEYLVVAYHNGDLSVYHKDKVVKSYSGLALCSVYHPTPGSQYTQFGRIFHLLDSGMVFFCLQKRKDEVVFINLQQEPIEIHHIPQASVEELSCMSLYQVGAFDDPILSPSKNIHNLFKSKTDWHGLKPSQLSLHPFALYLLSSTSKILKYGSASDDIIEYIIPQGEHWCHSISAFSEGVVLLSYSKKKSESQLTLYDNDFIQQDKLTLPNQSTQLF